MNGSRANLALVVSLVAAALAVVAVVLALRPARVPPELKRIAEAREVAQATSNRVRSATQMRGLTIALLAWAADHDGAAPPAEGWAEALLEGDYISADLLTVSGGAPVTTPYHYRRPTAEQVAVATERGGEVVVFYEDPGLWEGTGGNLVTLDTGAEWVEGAAYAERVRALRGQD